MDDALTIALISETVNATSLARRRAALVLLEELRAGRAMGSVTERLNPASAAEVGDELRSLIARYDIH